MHKKSFIVVLSTMLAVMVASVTLVFTVGPMVSADSVGVLDKAEYYNIEGTVLRGLSQSGIDYARSFSKVHFVIPTGVTEITGNKYFDSCSDFYPGYIGDKEFVMIELPDTLEIIGEAAFIGCDLTSIIIPDSVTEIGYHAFAACYKLSLVTIGKGVKSIRQDAFSLCRSLESIIIPNNVETIAAQIAYNSGLKTIYCEAESKPVGWDEYWNETSTGNGSLNNKLIKVVWGYNQQTDTSTREANNITAIAIAGGVGGTVGLGTIGTIVGVVVHKKRKLK